MKKIFILLFIIVFISAIFFLREKDDTSLLPQNLSKNDICVIDSMIIINYNGPKAQILWKNNKRSFYCEVREAFYDFLDPIKRKQIKYFFVQDFSNLEWGSYVDKWIIASEAFYVIDSIKDGAMGLTYVPFSDMNSANKFFNLYGGKLLKFIDINSDVLSVSSNLLKNRMIY